MSETAPEGEIPTDEQIHDWFPKLSEWIDEQLEEFEAEQETTNG